MDPDQGVEDVTLVILEWLGEQGVGAVVRVDAERLREGRPAWTFAAGGAAGGRSGCAFLSREPADLAPPTPSAVTRDPPAASLVAPRVNHRSRGATLFCSSLSL